MKKIIFLPFLLAVGMLNAQLQFGLKGGVNISNFTGGDFHNIEKSPYVAWHAGGLLRIKFDHLVLQPEVLFSTQGAKLDDGTTEDELYDFLCECTYNAAVAIQRWFLC